MAHSISTGGEAGGLATLLESLALQAERPLEESLALPAASYTSADLLDLETARIFEREWTCIGRLAEIPEVGDYLTFTVADRPVVAIRQVDAGVKVFANVCLHRCSQLLGGTGNARRIVCPYHAWTYKTDGTLIGAPHMDASPGFEVKGKALAELRTTFWEGFIYVTLSGETPPLEERIGGLQEVIGRYRLADYEPVILENEIWDTNWKILVENFMDAYHIFKVHRKTFDPDNQSLKRTTMHEGGDLWAYHTVKVPADDSRALAHPDNRWLEGDWRRTITLASVFPTHTMQIQPDMLWYLSIQPRGTEQLAVRWAVSIPREILAGGDRDAIVKPYDELLRAVNEEDKAIISGIRRGVNFSANPQGRLSYLERNVWEFGRYYSRRLTE
jgi:phenylpropionate dioxygenase-like ring-hydroxylating dioxygenase large terminal subunit